MGKVNIVEKNGKKYIDEEEILCEYECVSTFVIQAFYKDEFAPTHYDLASDSFIIDDATAFNTNIAEYFNSDTNTIQEKVLLAKTMQKEQFGLNADTKEILKAIDNPITKDLLKGTFLNQEVILGTTEDDVLQTTDTKSKILLDTGDDALQSGKGNNTFYFRRGDGSDTIEDATKLNIINNSLHVRQENQIIEVA